jgi:cell wall-associated NlpC family hydrolase
MKDMDMKYGINLHPLLPVRRSSEEISEMVTQLLFGELFEVTEVKPNWCNIKNRSDSYVGWVDMKMIHFVDAEEYKNLVSDNPYMVNSAFAEVKSLVDGENLYLPKGSLLYKYDRDKRKFSVSDRSYICLTGAFLLSSENPDLLLQTAESFLNAPYLWGGKSIFGIDCSGFVQVVFGLHNSALPRDAKDQFEMGQPVDYSERRAGDLAFFSGEKGNVIHVGILTEKDRIIHASGCVKTDEFHEKGIFSRELDRYTHTLCGIRRFDIIY